MVRPSQKRELTDGKLLYKFEKLSSVLQGRVLCLQTAENQRFGHSPAANIFGVNAVVDPRESGSDKVAKKQFLCLDTVFCGDMAFW